MDAADKPVPVTAAADTEAGIAVMVAATADTGLIGDADMPGVVAVPEGLLRDMTG